MRLQGEKEVSGQRLSGWQRLPLYLRAITVVLTLTVTQKTDAQEPYQIDGITAPQVKPAQLASKLEEQLRGLQRQVEQRSTMVNLQQALEAGLLGNPQIASAYQEIRGKEWNLIAVRRQWYPTLRASSNADLPGRIYEKDTEAIRDFQQEVSTSRITSSSAGLSIAWTFFDPSRGGNINSASESLRQQQLLFDVSARNLVLEIQQAYFELQERTKLISSYSEILNFTNRQVRITEAKFNAGMVSIADVEQIRTQQYATLSTLIETQKQLIDSSARLAEVMASPPGSLVLPSDELGLLTSWDIPLQASIKQALSLREEIQASLAAANSASWRASALFNTYWPSFSIGASGQYRNSARDTEISASGVNNRFSSKEESWNGSFGLGFTWQFFDGGINAAQAEVQKSASGQALDEASTRRLRVTREVEQAYAGYLTAQLALQSSEAQANAANAAAVAVQKRFDVGVSDMASLVVALNEAIIAANTYASAVKSYNNAVAGLYRSSAVWPSGTLRLLKNRISKLQTQ